MPYADALAVEEAWFTSPLVGVPVLVAEDGGPFDIVAAQVRRLSQARRQLFLGHGPTTSARGSKTGDRFVTHEVVALVFWSAPGAGGRAHEDQASLDEATERVLARVRGPVGDYTHGGRWWSVGEARVEPPNPATLLAFRDAAGAVGAGYELAVKYSVTELLPGL